MAKALSQPNVLSDGRSESTVTAKPAGEHHRSQDQRRSDEHGRPLHADAGIGVGVDPRA